MADDRPVPLDEYPAHQAPTASPPAVLDRKMKALAPRGGGPRPDRLPAPLLPGPHRPLGRRGRPGFRRRGNIERRYAERTGHTPRDMDFHPQYAALRTRS